MRIYSWLLAATALLIVCVHESMCLTCLLINLHAYQIILEFGHRQFNIFEAVLFVSCCLENFHIKALIARPLLWLNLNLIWLNFVVIIDIYYYPTSKLKAFNMSLHFYVPPVCIREYLLSTCCLFVVYRCSFYFSLLLFCRWPLSASLPLEVSYNKTFLFFSFLWSPNT